MEVLLKLVRHQISEVNMRSQRRAISEVVIFIARQHILHFIPPHFRNTTSLVLHIQIKAVWVSTLSYLFSESAQFSHMVCARSSYLNYI